MPRLLLSSTSFKKRRGLRLELLRLPKFDLSSSSPLCRLRRRRRPFLAPSNSTFQFDIRESRPISAFASASTPLAGRFSPRVAPKSPRSFEEADPRVTYKGVGVISKSESTTMWRGRKENIRVLERAWQRI